MSDGLIVILGIIVTLFVYPLVFGVIAIHRYVKTEFKRRSGFSYVPGDMLVAKDNWYQHIDGHLCSIVGYYHDTLDHGKKTSTPKKQAKLFSIGERCVLLSVFDSPDHYALDTKTYMMMSTDNGEMKQFRFSASKNSVSYKEIDTGYGWQVRREYALINEIFDKQGDTPDGRKPLDPKKVNPRGKAYRVLM